MFMLQLVVFCNIISYDFLTVFTPRSKDALPHCSHKCGSLEDCVTVKSLWAMFECHNNLDTGVALSTVF